MLSKYSIRDLERLSGIKAHTLRIWEQRYEILNPERTDTNIRYYSNEDLKRILNISLLNNNGYKISSIAKLSNDKLLEEVNKFLNCFLKESDQIENLVLCLMDMNEARFESTINKSITHFGFENTIEKVVFPFLSHMGNMWQIGMINPAQEHYISNLVRQKIISGIDGLKQPAVKSTKTYVFFLPDRELHELGLLYACYLTKARGHRCLYLGQSVPLEYLLSVANNIRPDYMVSVFTAKVPGMDVNAFLKSCEQNIGDCEFLISGRLLLDPAENCGPPSKKFTVFENFQAYRKCL